jgi:hypothetical protein
MITPRVVILGRPGDERHTSNVSLTDPDPPDLPVPDDRGLRPDANGRIDETSALVSRISSSSDSGDSAESQTEIDQTELHRQALHLKAAEKLSEMDVINPEVLRVTPAYRAFERCAQALRVGKDGDLYFKSEKSDKVSTFWSHSWRGGHRGKIITLMTFYNGAPAVILGSLVAVLMMFLFGFADLPAWYRIESNGVGHARWSLCFGFLATSVAMLFWRPQDRVFLDRICIHEKDLTLKTQAILSLAGLLKKSDLMLILWDPTWTERMWCLFELAAFLKSRKAQTTKQELIIRPVLLGPVSIEMFITSSVVMFPLTFLGGAVSGGIMTYAPLVSLIFLGGLVTIYMFVGTLRSYFQDLETMKQQLKVISFDRAQSTCCEQDHVNESGNSYLCDRLLVQKCINVWFGSQEAFEETVRSEVLDIVSRDLTHGVFTGKWVLGVTVPILWSFMDMAAYHIVSAQKLWHFRALNSLLNGLTTWLTLPAVIDLGVTVCNITRGVLRNHCLDMKNFVITLFATVLSVGIPGSCLLMTFFLFHVSRLERAGLFFACMLIFSLVCRCLTFGIKTYWLKPG